MRALGSAIATELAVVAGDQSVKRLLLFERGGGVDTIPVVASAFPPAGQPLLAELLLGVGTVLLVSPANTRLITTLVSALGHIAFLSSHRADASIFQRVLTAALRWTKAEGGDPVLLL